MKPIIYLLHHFFGNLPIVLDRTDLKKFKIGFCIFTKGTNTSTPQKHTQFMYKSAIEHYIGFSSVTLKLLHYWGI